MGCAHSRGYDSDDGAAVCRERHVSANPAHTAVRAERTLSEYLFTEEDLEPRAPDLHNGSLRKVPSLADQLREGRETLRPVT